VRELYKLINKYSTLLVLVLIGATGCSDNANNLADDTLEVALEKSAIRLGFANEAPYAYVDPQSGELAGEAPDIARHVLSELGVSEVTSVLTEFGSLIPGLKAGRFDVIAAGMYVLPERCKEVIFSNPTYSVGESFLVKSGNPHKLNAYSDILENPNTKLGVVSGTVELTYANKLNIPKGQIIVYPDIASAVSGVKAGRSDAFAGTSLTVQRIVQKDTSQLLERAFPFEDPVIAGVNVRGYGAFAFRKNDVRLRDAFNEKLAQFIGSEKHRDMVLQYGFTESELPKGVTTSELCLR
jgi:polar amino acid transport system substrate-binding protein